MYPRRTGLSCLSKIESLALLSVLSCEQSKSGRFMYSRRNSASPSSSKFQNIIGTLCFCRRWETRDGDAEVTAWPRSLWKLQVKVTCKTTQGADACSRQRTSTDDSSASAMVEDSGAQQDYRKAFSVGYELK